MSHLPHRSPWRRAGLYLLILLALSLVSTVAVVIARDDEPFDSEEVFPEPVTVNPDKQPRFRFPVELRTTDLALNRFVDRFFRLAGQAKYSEVKLMLSNRTGDELLPRRFESIFNVMKEVRVLSIKRLPDLPGAEGPAWLLSAEYDLEDYAPRTKKKDIKVRLCIATEDGSYRVRPFSHEDSARLTEYESRMSAAASQPAGGGPAATTDQGDAAAMTADPTQPGDPFDR